MHPTFSKGIPMPRLQAVSIAVVLLLMGACGEQQQVTAPVRGSIFSAQTGKPISLPTVSLIVTVSDADGTGAAYNIQSDGQGVYTNGTQNVQAILDQSGTFAFNTNTFTNRAAIRWVKYTFNNPVDPSNSYRPSPSNSKNYHFSTGPSAFSTFTPLQNLGINGNPTTEWIYMGNGLSSSTADWRVSFHKGQEDTGDSQTAYAFVTRTSVSPAGWTITPVGSCSPNSIVASLRSGDGTVLYGYYNIPFFFTLRAK